ELLFDEDGEPGDAERIDQAVAHQRLVVVQRVGRAAYELRADEGPQHAVDARRRQSAGRRRAPLVRHHLNSPSPPGLSSCRYLRRFSGRAIFPLEVLTTHPRSTMRTSPSVIWICCATARR